MKNKNDKRLIGAFEYIDDKFIESAAKKIKAREDGVSALGANKAKIIKQVALLAACLVLLGAALPLAGRIVGLIPELFNPAGTANESEVLETNENDLPEEYFTAGDGFLSYPSYFLGVEYDGCWIHKSAAYKNLTGAKMEFFEYLYKYDPVAKTSTSLCINSSCKHKDESCPAFIPVGWLIDSITVFDDWCMYQISGTQATDNDFGSTKVCLYNMKTGESKLVAETVKLEDSITYPLRVFVLNGKVYINLCEDTIRTGQGVGSFDRHYVCCYDPVTGVTEDLCNVPGAMYMIGLTNKRILYSEMSVVGDDSPAAIWTTDYSGENLKEMKNLTFRPEFVCGTLAYGAGENNTVLAYDLATDSTSTIDFGNIQYVYLDSGELGFTTTSRIEEYNEYHKDPDAYIAQNYPGVTDPDKISKLKSETELKLNCKVDMQFYLTDSRGGNQALVFEGENINFKPYRRVGDHIIGSLIKASKYEMNILDSGFAALNLKTGEFEMIPTVKFD